MTKILRIKIEARRTCKGSTIFGTKTGESFFLCVPAELPNLDAKILCAKNKQENHD